MAWQRVPGWSDEEMRAALAVPLAERQQEAERALLEAIAAHARASLTSDADHQQCCARAVAFCQALALLRASAREGQSGGG